MSFRMQVPHGLKVPPHSTGGYSFEELADWRVNVNAPGKPYQMRIDEIGQPLRIPYGYPGAGNPATWGYLTPQESRLPRVTQVVVRTVPTRLKP